MTPAALPAIASDASDRFRASSASPSVQHRAEVGQFDFVFAIAAALAELLLAALPILTPTPIAVALVLHLFVMAALGLALYRRRQADADLSAPVLIMIATAAAGPVGASLGLMALAWLSRSAQSSELLSAWYDRIALATNIDPVTQLADRVASGRVIDASAPPPQALVGVVRHGTLEERQAALGLIARFFHLNHLSALSDALRSDVPVIRVQAAAVAARIRTHLAQEIEQRLERAADMLREGATEGRRARALARLQLIREFDQAIVSHLLEQPLSDAASAMAARLASSIDARTLGLHDGGSFEMRAGLEAYEARLVAAGQFKRLRLLRRRRRMASRGLPFTRIRLPGRNLAGAVSRQPSVSAEI